MCAKRSGIAAILALIFLTMFAALAVAYASTINTNVQQAKNLYHVANARLQAESGLSFVAYQLVHASVPDGATGQPLLNALATSLQARLNGTPNLGGGTVAYDNTTIRIPAIVLDPSGREFNADVTLDGGNIIHVKVFGRDGSASRAIGIDFDLAPGNSAVFGYGVATKSSVVLTGNAQIKGKNNASEANVLSATYSTPEAFKLTGNNVLQGDIYASNPDAYATMTGNISIGGVSANDPNVNSHIHTGVNAGDFPEVKPAVFEPFATTIVDSHTNVSGTKTFTNIRIKANTNPNFAGNITLKGVVYVEQPNKVSFAGNTNITGVIVTQDAGDNNYASNYVKFSGNVLARGVEELPDTSDFHVLRTMPGAFVLAPGFGLQFTGNFGTVGGCMAADSYTFMGNASGVVRGCIINYSDSAFTLTGNSSLIIDRNGTPDVPPGFSVKSAFTADPETYVEYGSAT